VLPCSSSPLLPCHLFPRKPYVKQVILALDVGDARIGLAIGTIGSSFAFGRGFMVRKKMQEDILALHELCTQEKAEYIVVGLPKSKDGSDSLQTQKVRSFAGQLEKAGLKVVLEDERFTTRLASKQLQNLSKQKRQEKGRLDEVSAVAILESHLARMSTTRADS
jgi:putative holliday junction resolvase